MNLRGIAIYCLRAGAFAAAACAGYAIFCHARKRPVRLKRLAAIAYLAALVQITVLRGGVDWNIVFSGGREARLQPLFTIMDAWNRGAWDFIYHTLGNLAWFVPLGFLLRKGSGWRALTTGAALSACIELAQFILRTGVTDIDDIILNALGAWLGWMACRAVHKKKCG